MLHYTKGVFWLSNIQFWLTVSDKNLECKWKILIDKDFICHMSRRQSVTKALMFGQALIFSHSSWRSK